MRRLTAVLAASLLLAACDSTVDPPTNTDGGGVVTAPIMSVSTYAVDKVAPILLAYHFSATDGSATFAAVSDAPSIASVTLDDGRLVVRAISPGTALITVTATSTDGTTAQQTFTVTTLDPCGTSPPPEQDLFPITSGMVWTFDWTTVRTVNGSPLPTFIDTMTWTFEEPTCQRGTRSVAFIQTYSGSRYEPFPPGSVIQTGTGGTLSFNSAVNRVSGTFSRTGTGLGGQIPAECYINNTPSDPTLCAALTLEPGRGITTVRYVQRFNSSSAVLFDRGTLTRTN